MQPLKEEDKEMALNFLRSLVTPSRSCLLVESPSAILPGIAKTEASTEGLCMALTEVQYQEMVKNGDIKKPLCVLTGSKRCPCTPGGPGGCFPEPEPGAPQPLPISGLHLKHAKCEICEEDESCACNQAPSAPYDFSDY